MSRAVNSFIVERYSQLFNFLGKLSAFSLARKVFPGLNTYGGVEVWVICHTLLAALCVIVVERWTETIWAALIVAYGALRVFEINVYQINVLLFGEYRAIKQGKTYALGGYRRLVILLIHNYFEIIFWFACTYIFFADNFTHKWQEGYRTVIGALYSSFIAMSTFGDFNMNPADAFGATILFFQSASGLFMTLLSLARFIGLLPKPATLDRTEKSRRRKR